MTRHSSRVGRFSSARQAFLSIQPERVFLICACLLVVHCHPSLTSCAPQNDGKLSYEAAAGSGIGLIIAGNDTSGLGVSALLATLPLFPDVLKRLRQEQQQVGCAMVSHRC